MFCARLVPLLLLCAGSIACSSSTLVDGQARFQLLTPSLVRFEFADDRLFEDGVSFNRAQQRLPPVHYTTRIVDDWREIRTDEILIRYLRGSGPFNRDNLTVQLLREKRVITPFAGPSKTPLGGWLRALDAQGDPVPLHDALLNRDGAYVLDDTTTAVADTDGWVKPRLPHIGFYSDQFLFVYGKSYARALADLVALTGPPPLLPRWAFGVWYSRYFPYSAADYHDTLLPHFRSDKVPLDVLVVDTDWKAPSGSNGWSWNTKLFPDGNGFLKWAGGEGLHVTLNIHPSIDAGDPNFAAANTAAGGLARSNEGSFIWDWGDRKQAAGYFSLHDPFDGNGVRFWWLDWCCEQGIVEVPGAAPHAELVSPDSWINQLYAERATKRGLRGFSFARIGGKFAGHAAVQTSSPTGPWADHRNTIHFTGDTFPTWQMLGFQVGFTVAEGSMGMPYVTHDLGSFFGKHIPDDLYLRWLEFGVFQPIFRLHSHHGDRLPWDYPEPVRVAAEKFMQLRESLVPYLYTLGREAFDTGMPMVRGLFFAYPDAEDAYAHRLREYMLGDSLLVMPIASADAKIFGWFPPGTWVDIFTGERHVSAGQQAGQQVVTATVDTMPVFARAGAIIPRQPPMNYVGERPVDPLLLDVYAGADGAFSMYEDEGEGLAYRAGQFRRTPMRYVEAHHALIIDGAVGSYKNAPSQRGYEIELIALAAAPQRVLVDGKELSADQWRYDETRHAVKVRVAPRAIDHKLTVELQ